MGKPVGLLGALVALIGFIGKIAGEMYIEDNPIQGAAGKLAEALGGETDLQMQLALFFDEYGLMIGVVGLVLLGAGVLLRRA